MVKITKDDLMDLTKFQLQTLVKVIRDKLNLGITGANKEKLVETIFTLHDGNKFKGKPLLSFDNKGHIKLPERTVRTAKEKGTTVRKFKPRTIKGSATLKRGELEDEIKNKKQQPQYVDVAPQKRKFNTKTGYLEL